jgi:hypothetical protein
MLEGRGEANYYAGMIMALNGDRVLQRVCFERLIPVTQPPATRFRLPKNEGEPDMKKVLISVLKQTAAGTLSTPQAVDLGTFAEIYTRTLGDIEHEGRLAAVENDDLDKAPDFKLAEELEPGTQSSPEN